LTRQKIPSATIPKDKNGRLSLTTSYENGLGPGAYYNQESSFGNTGQAFTILGGRNPQRVEKSPGPG
jgi:hypothetical protein